MIKVLPIVRALPVTDSVPCTVAHDSFHASDPTSTQSLVKFLKYTGLLLFVATTA